MAFTLLQVGGMLKTVNSTGGLSSALTLPTGIVLATNRVPRFAKFKQYLVVVNTPSRPLSVDTNGNVRLLTPSAPSMAVALTGPTVSTTLSGTYLALQTYQIRDGAGNIIAESDYGPLMGTALTVALHKLTATYQVSQEAVNASQFWRTTDNGNTYFPWVLITDNVTTTFTDDTADAALGLVERPNLGSAPDLTLIAEFGGRLWGVDRNDVDDLRWTEAGTMYAWSALNTLPIPHVGADAAGITALIPRRDALGVARRDMFLSVSGSTTTNIRATTVNGGEQTGVLSQESVVVFNDVAYFLWRDGVYRWDSTGITCLTNGRVRSWFVTDTTFNRAMFWRAVAQIDPVALRYRLFLASAGSAALDRWIEMDLLTGAWYGPHRTDAFNPTCAVLVAGTDQQPYFMIGSQEGYLSQEQDAKNDWGVMPISLSAQTKRHYLEEPDYEKYFGEMSVNGPVQTAGSITVTPTVGETAALPDPSPFTYDMTQGRQVLGRLGSGKQASVQFDHDTLNEDVVLYGYEINPVTIIGRR